MPNGDRSCNTPHLVSEESDNHI